MYHWGQRLSHEALTLSIEHTKPDLDLFIANGPAAHRPVRNNQRFCSDGIWYDVATVCDRLQEF